LWTEHLTQIRNNLDSYFYLMNDIDFNEFNFDLDIYNTGDLDYIKFSEFEEYDINGWLPIGNDVNTFSGLFDGQKNIIKNLYINRSSSDYQGLFGYNSNGEIKSIALKEVNVIGNDYVGGLIGFDNSSNQEITILNCSVIGTVSGNDYVGGLIGYNKGIVLNSFSEGEVHGNSFIGGFVGRNNSQIYNSYSKSNVSGSDILGGFTGEQGHSFQFDDYFLNNCYSTGFVLSNIEDPLSIGGLIGKIPLMSYSNIRYSYWDVNTSVQETSKKGDPKTTEEMKQQATFENWDFENIWQIDEDQTYPYLQEDPDPSLPGGGVVWKH
jgi:hypothetical protein